MIIGITGGSGSGKSTVSRCFEKKGFVNVDTDKIGHSILMPDGLAYSEIVSHFGTEILNSDGTINRKLLGKIVFSNPEELKVLNKISHYYITKTVKDIIKNNKNVAIDGALLIESKISFLCDKLIYVHCPEEVRIARIMERDVISKQDALLRISSQNSEEFYKNHCHYTIINSGQENIENQVEEFLNCLENLSDS